MVDGAILFGKFAIRDVNDSRSEHDVGELNLISHTRSVLEKEYGRDRQTYQSIFPPRQRGILSCPLSSVQFFVSDKVAVLLGECWLIFGCTIPGARECNFTQVMTW